MLAFIFCFPECGAIQITVRTNVLNFISRFWRVWTICCPFPNDPARFIRKEKAIGQSSVSCLPGRRILLEAVVISEGDCSRDWQIKSVEATFWSLSISRPLSGHFLYLVTDMKDYTTCIGNDARTTREFFSFSCKLGSWPCVATGLATKFERPPTASSESSIPQQSKVTTLVKHIRYIITPGPQQFTTTMFSNDIGYETW